MKEVGIRFHPSDDDLMNGIFKFYRKKGFHDDFDQKGYLQVNESSGAFAERYLGKKNETAHFATSSSQGECVQIRMKNLRKCRKYRKNDIENQTNIKTAMNFNRKQRVEKRIRKIKDK